MVDTGGEGSQGGQEHFLLGDPKLHEEQKKVACERANAPHSST